VIDPENGRVTDVVLTRIRGTGAKEVVAPFSTVSKILVTTFLYSAPEEVHQFHGEAPYESWGFHLYSKQKVTASLTARKLIGSTVKTSKGEDLGRIEDLIIDHMSGCVVNLVVSGKEGKLAKVPFSALSESGKNVFILKTT
jgi:sporulation protein YlmC with PRC-barrel domain